MTAKAFLKEKKKEKKISKICINCKLLLLPSQV